MIIDDRSVVLKENPYIKKKREGLDRLPVSKPPPKGKIMVTFQDDDSKKKEVGKGEFLTIRKSTKKDFLIIFMISEEKVEKIKSFLGIILKEICLIKRREILSQVGEENLRMIRIEAGNIEELLPRSTK